MARDKDILNNQILGLRQVVDSKNKEVTENRTNAHMQAIRANENDKKFRDASQEAELWKLQTAKIEREKSNEIELERNLRNS